MSETAPHVVIVGAGHAGGTAAAVLRQYGFAGHITLVGQEPIPPYQRPPLSKAWLKGEADADALTLKPESFYAEHDIDLRTGVTATAIDAAARTVALERGAPLAYDILIIATGARARSLAIPGADLAGVLSLRSAADAEQLKAALGPGCTLAVIGGGYIGLEAAASARALGSDVVVLEREPNVLARVAKEPLASFFADYHRQRGVRFEVSARVEAFEGVTGHITGVRLGDGRTIGCTLALVSVGLARNDELARAAGLDCSTGPQ
ncbi:MAG TPA: FAD-dependent oxidoreductase, partial [Caulobacteraceae bacterium]|nr:FAD-dependent oxidoreductase [Caulobacteraceae bacterium]